MKKHLPVLGIFAIVFTALILHVVFAQNTSGSGEYSYEYGEYGSGNGLNNAPTYGCSDAFTTHADGSVTANFTYDTSSGYTVTLNLGNGSPAQTAPQVGGTSYTYPASPLGTFNPFLTYGNGTGTQYPCGTVTVSAPIPPSNAPANVTGWAWSSNIGWISFSSSTPGSGGGNYGVVINPNSGYTSGTFGGYAWSPNIGWISFDSANLAGCPGATGGTVNLSSTGNGQVTGWIRAIAGKGRTDGWDGCIELSGSPNHLSPANVNGIGGVTFNPTNGQFRGFAWGGDVVGWINFSPKIGVNPVTCTGCTGPGNPNPITATCTVAPSSVPADGTGPVTLSETSVSGGSGSGYTYTWSTGVGAQSSGSVPSYTYHLPANTTSPTPVPYSTGMTVTDSSNNSSGATPISCGTVTVAGTTVTSSPVSLKIGPDTVHLGSTYQVSQGDPFTLVWSGLTGSGDTTCSVTAPSAFSGLAFQLTDASGNYIDGNLPNAPTSTSIPAGNYTFTLACNDAGGNPITPSSAVLQVATSIIHEK